jgi:hypothetical protein
MNRRASTRVARGPVRAVLAVEALAAMVSARAAHADDCHATSSLTPRLEGRSGTGLLAGVCADADLRALPGSSSAVSERLFLTAPRDFS